MAQTDRSPAAAGRKALDLLLSEKYPELSKMFSQSMKQTVTLDFLKERVSAELKEFGAARSVGEPVLGTAGVNHLVSFPVQFTNTNIHVQFTLDPSGQVAGMYFRPPNKPLPTAWHAPAYSKPESFHEREVTVGEDEWKLGGTLTLPKQKGPFAGIVLVHGPGPDDRDESLFATKIFKDLAEGLASRGYAVLRYEKRTKAYPDRMSTFAYTTREEIVDDAARALALMRRQPEVDPARVFVLGHSLGGYISPRVGTRDGKLAGLILLAGNARPIEDLVLEQSKYLLQLKSNPDAGDQARLDKVKAEVQQVKNLSPSGDYPPVLLGRPAEYFLDLKGYDPAATARQLKIPILILQGERDFQVTMKDFALWKSAFGAQKNVTSHSYPALNHLFIAGEGQGSPAEYHNAGNVSPQVVDDISAWLSARQK